MTWISVKDRIPTSRTERCLICCAKSGEIQLASVGQGTWSGHCGKGNLSRALLDKGYNVISSDLYVGESALGTDFLTTDQPSADIIVTNPPFSDKDAFLARCYELGKPFALLLPVTSLGGQYRQNLYRKHGLQILMLGRRIHFETPSGQGKGAWQEHAWFTNGLHLPKDITFATIDNAGDARVEGRFESDYLLNDNENSPPQPCGHDKSNIVSGKEGTSYCGACEDEARDG